MSGALSETGFGRNKFRTQVNVTEDLILILLPELAPAVQFQRDSRKAIIKSTRKWCLLHVQSLEAACREAEYKLQPDIIPPRHLK